MKINGLLENQTLPPVSHPGDTGVIPCAAGSFSPTSAPLPSGLAVVGGPATEGDMRAPPLWWHRRKVNAAGAPSAGWSTHVRQNGGPRRSGGPCYIDVAVMVWRASASAGLELSPFYKHH
jgi:hypothetical protein